ncbi:MAG: 50S ribosomal protein L30 [Candidatus Heimdallarchaeota archaeon]|nr:50S ribosomal protein L30 [Candidatus Heimdallarchaeota archaeon]
MTEDQRTKRFVVIRIRGTLDRSYSVKRTLELLKLHKSNHCVLLDDRKTYRGMLQKAKDLITWGEPDAQTLKELLLKRGRVIGGDKFTEDYLKKHTNFTSLDQFIEKYLSFEAELSDIEGLKPVFRLHPPKKGHERGGVKYAYTTGGALGYRADDINKLLIQMS